MEKDYINADSANLPKIDVLMVGSFFATNSDFCSAEFRNVKTSVSSRDSYGDDAVGYVQLHRDTKTNLCTVKCKICPEHKVRSKPYKVTLIVNEKADRILSVQCHDCAASQGGCKHSVAFLMWMHRRSEEPPCTSVQCYWKKSKLAQVGSTIKFVKAKDLSKNKKSSSTSAESLVFTKFVNEAKRCRVNNCQILKHLPDYEVKGVQMLSLHHLFLQYSDGNDCKSFLESIHILFSEESIKEIEEKTRDQHQNELWYAFRYGRITASIAYEVSRCKTLDGSLIATIMGARTPDTSAMRRGRLLEEKVRQNVEKEIGKIDKCGLFISKQHPIIAGSPDGILHDAIIEIKCPASEQSFKNYIKNARITAKFLCQVQIQMYVTGLKNCYFCVAHWEFEKNEKVQIIKISYDETYVNNMLNILLYFWKNNIYPLLSTSTKIE